MIGEKLVYTHVESTPGFLRNINSHRLETRYVSGHHRLPDVLANLDVSEWFLFTTLRNPVQHLLSHLKWVKAIGAPGNELLRSRHSVSIQEMAGRLWHIGLNNIDGIHRMINEDFTEAKQYFDNNQTRYMIDYRAGLIGHPEAVEAVEALGKFDHVGFAEDIPNVLAIIDQILGMDSSFTSVPRENRSPLDEDVNLSDQTIRDFYREAVKWDALLYTKAKALFE